VSREGTSEPPTIDDARSFADAADSTLYDVGTRAERARWVYSTFITEDTSRIASEAMRDLIDVNAHLALDATRFDGLELPEDVERRIAFLKVALPSLAPGDHALQAELSEIGAAMEGAYGKGRHTRPDGTSLTLDDLSRIIAHSRDPEALLDAWTGWHRVGRGIREPYRRFVEISNAGARAVGFADNGERWRASYDMPPEAFVADIERLWSGVEGLYRSLHAYVRRRLGERYGTSLVPSEGPIPAHLLGDMWAQDWVNVMDVVAPPGSSGHGYDLTDLLVAHGFDAVRMVRAGEAFFTSLGFDPLPDTFWTRSMFTRPADRDVVCHASAWTIDEDLDLRLKMCIEVTGQDFVTVHHELGHTFYQRAYRHQPYLFRTGANDGFHEAIGDAIARSVTPEYLVRIGLLDEAPGDEGDLPLLLHQALESLPRLAWELVVDRWRWGVFSGEIGADRYNEAWWELRRSYQGVAAPVLRTEEDFDPGAKYHIPANVPYMRYFLATFLQYQFHASMSEIAGLDGPLHRRSVYGSRAAGERLEEMLAMGRSKPWPDALERLTGSRRVEAGPLLEYFEPLRSWLDEQNAGAAIGW
jgi:peptidyl-dipeptidase A